MGFVAEELNETERLHIRRNKVSDMAVVYGKEASMWKVSVSSLRDRLASRAGDFRNGFDRTHPPGVRHRSDRLS